VLLCGSGLTSPSAVLSYLRREHTPPFFQQRVSIPLFVRNGQGGTRGWDANWVSAYCRRISGDMATKDFPYHSPIPNRKLDLGILSSLLERHDLRGGVGAITLGEKHVVVLAAVEVRVEVDQVNRLVADVLPQNDEVIAVIELILFHCGAILARIDGLGHLFGGVSGTADPRSTRPHCVRLAQGGLSTAADRWRANDPAALGMTGRFVLLFPPFEARRVGQPRVLWRPCGAPWSGLLLARHG
jgi:hypothetical protein